MFSSASGQASRATDACSSIDAGGSMRCALVGDAIATLALDSGWAGIVLNGCVRDSRELERVGLGIKALGTNPRAEPQGRLGRRSTYP